MIFGGDVRTFHVPADSFAGIIGGPPCQDFSRARRTAPTGAGLELIGEYLRIVTESAPAWWLMENVPGSPNVTAPGYLTQIFNLDASQCGSQQRRLRKFHFGHRAGTRELIIARPGPSQPGESQRTCMATEGRRAKRRDWREFCRLQGLPDDFDLPAFTVLEKYRAVGNGVPFAMAVTLANAIADWQACGTTPHRVCECGCGAFVTGRERMASPACRKRQQRKRDAAAGPAPARSQMTFM